MVRYWYQWYLDVCSIWNAQVLLSQEPKWVPAEITVPRNSRQDLPPQQVRKMKWKELQALFGLKPPLQAQYTTWSVVQKPHRDLIAGPDSQPLAQGALELYCSHLQLQLHRTFMLGCDRKELNALLKTLRSIYGLGIKSPFDKTDFIDHFIICTRLLNHKIWCVLPISLLNADQTLRETAFVLSLSDQINLDHLQW